MFKSIGAYWVQFYSDQSFGVRGTTDYITVAVMAHSRDEAITQGQRIATRRSYGAKLTHARDGVINLSALRGVVICEDHPDQTLDPLISGRLCSQSVKLSGIHNPPDVERIEVDDLLSGWCAAGPHRVRGLWTPEIEAAILAAVIQ